MANTLQSPSPHRPTLRDMIGLETPLTVRVAPDGRRLAIRVRTTNWRDNRYETACHIYDVTHNTIAPLTRSGSVGQVEWIDVNTLALLKRGYNGVTQIWLYESLIGEGWQVTDHKTGIDWFYPFANGFVFLAAHPKRDKKKERTDRFGRFTHFEQEKSPSALYYVGLEAMRAYRADVKAATDDEAKKLVEPVIELSKLLDEPLAIKQVIPSPTSDALYLSCWPHEDLVYLRQTSTYRIALDAEEALATYLAREAAKKEADDEADKADEHDAQATPTRDDEDSDDDHAYLGTITRLPLPHRAWVSAVSPDGLQLLILHPGRDDKLYTREDVWSLSVSDAVSAPDVAACQEAMVNLSAPLDRQILSVRWRAAGIFASYVDGTGMRFAQLDMSAEPRPLDLSGVFLYGSFDAGAAGHIALVGANATSVPEVYRLPANGAPEKVTDYGKAVADWELGTVETLRWTSRDGVEIEGVLRKPDDFDPKKRYPLVFIVHGGPSWFSPAYLLSGEDIRYYPAVQFAHKDVLVLKPNYRGSLGRGQAFSELNVGNLGIGDLWDLESAIDHLDALGWVDPERVGCMGWSQGGYISAFAGLHSDRFQAVSVGAGISDWYTYHISNDIPDFTVDYLAGSPFRSRELYDKTAPISNLANAQTPMLIQHGTEDRRVPVSNAFELYRGLKEMAVPVELFIFPGMGHPITKPRENHAVMHQNLAWFSHYLLGEPLELT